MKEAEIYMCRLKSHAWTTKNRGDMYDVRIQLTTQYIYKTDSARQIVFRYDASQRPNAIRY